MNIQQVDDDAHTIMIKNDNAKCIVANNSFATKKKKKRKLQYFLQIAHILKGTEVF